MTDMPDPERVRDLVRHLPDLLSGPDPILQGATAVELIRKDASLRLALIACAEVLDMTRAGTRALTTFERRLPPEVHQPIEVAKRHMATRFVESLYAVGLYYAWLEAQKDDTFFTVFSLQEPRPRTTAEVIAASEQVFERLGLRRALVKEWAPRPLAGFIERDPGTGNNALLAFDGCIQTRPDLYQVVFWHTFLRMKDQPPMVRERAWRRVAKEFGEGPMSGYAAHQLAITLAARGRHLAAVHVQLNARQELPDDLFVHLYGMLYSLVAGGWRETRIFLDGLLSSIRSHSSHEHLATKVLSDVPVSWPDLRNNPAMDTVIRELPQSLQNRLIGILQ